MRLMSAQRPGTRNIRGRGLPGCGPRRHGSELDVTETHRAQPVHAIGVLVESRREAERVREGAAEAAHRQVRRNLERRPERSQPAQSGEPQAVRQFRIQPRENGQRCAGDDRCGAALHAAGGNTPGNAATKRASALPND